MKRCWSSLHYLYSGTLSRSETPREVLQRVFSDGYLSSYQATPAVSPIASKISLDDVVGLGKDLKWSSEEHMNRCVITVSIVFNRNASYNDFCFAVTV